MESEVTPAPEQKVPFRQHLLVFLRSQASAFAGGMCDYGIMILLKQYAHVFLPVAIVISGSIGAVINFLINRHWTFKKAHVNSRTQLQKFVVVVAGSIALKSGGTYFFSKILPIDYKIIRLCVDAVVALAFNFTLQRFWVFKEEKKIVISPVDIDTP